MTTASSRWKSKAGEIAKGARCRVCGGPMRYRGDVLYADPDYETPVLECPRCGELWWAIVEAAKPSEA